jgi:hypothetical protein
VVVVPEPAEQRELSSGDRRGLGGARCREDLPGTALGARSGAPFPDGQLHVNLRGFGPEQPLEPDHALSGFLEALGIPNEQIPVDVEQRAGLYRSLLTGRRSLLLLDNARNGAQVRPLLPRSGPATVVVTSRSRL